VGPICKTVEDAALVLGAIAGYDPMDPTTVDHPAPDYTRAFGIKTSDLRLGIPRSPFFEGIDPEVAEAVDAAVEVLRKMTKSVVDTQLPPTGQLLTIAGAEAYAYHSRWLAESPDRYQTFTRERIIALGAEVTASTYANALRETHQLRRQIVSVFTNVDLLITPTMPRPPETLAQSKSFDPIGIRNASPFNVLGLPSISVPCGFTSSGLPIGLQISGAPFAESTVLALAHAFEQATEWHKRKPELTAV
jgi:aspartyl-tRNA(Asn)/glutamyl-tRNA(Gln) amidotransferase subunit A